MAKINTGRTQIDKRIAERLRARGIYTKSLVSDLLDANIMKNLGHGNGGQFTQAYKASFGLDAADQAYVYGDTDALAV